MGNSCTSARSAKAPPQDTMEAPLSRCETKEEPTAWCPSSNRLNKEGNYSVPETDAESHAMAPSTTTITLMDSWTTAHTEKLLDISSRRLDGALFFADAAEALPQDVEKIEAAVQGLRKCWLRRPLCPRCDRCGVRHEDIEFSTCRFWQEWAAYDDVQAAATDSE